MIIINCIQQTWSFLTSCSLPSFSSGEAWSILSGRVLHPGTNWWVSRPNQGCLPLNSSSPPLQGQEKGHYWTLYHCLHMHRWRLWEQCVSTGSSQHEQLCLVVVLLIPTQRRALLSYQSTVFSSPVHCRVEFWSLMDSSAFLQQESFKWK